MQSKHREFNNECQRLNIKRGKSIKSERAPYIPAYDKPQKSKAEREYQQKEKYVQKTVDGFINYLTHNWQRGQEAQYAQFTNMVNQDWVKVRKCVSKIVIVSLENENRSVYSTNLSDEMYRQRNSIMSYCLGKR